MFNNENYRVKKFAHRILIIIGQIRKLCVLQLSSKKIVDRYVLRGYQLKGPEQHLTSFMDRNLLGLL